jgi:predicted ABC-type ATPase
MTDKPQLIIIGGANGSGKTTLAREFVRLENYTYLGADEIAGELNAQQPEQVAIEAARVFSRKFGEYLEKKESLIVESTLSGLSLRKWIEKARSFDYAVKILFVYLSSPELCIQRVAARVAKGGHDVPEADIKRRFARANLNFWHVYRDLADEWSLFYNAGDNIFQVAGGDRRGEIILDEARFIKWNEMVKN